jgi:hypothetical protein
LKAGVKEVSNDDVVEMNKHCDLALDFVALDFVASALALSMHRMTSQLKLMTCQSRFEFAKNVASKMTCIVIYVESNNEINPTEYLSPTQSAAITPAPLTNS